MTRLDEYEVRDEECPAARERLRAEAAAHEARLARERPARAGDR